MDTIRFEVKHADEPAIFQNGRNRTEELAILINGRDLIDLLREVELPFAIREDYPPMAGDYRGVSPDDLFEDAGALLGDPKKGWNTVEGQVVLLGHTCGDVYCWPMSVRVTVDKDRIIWSDFEQQHRDASMGEDQWTYEALGPFAFDHRQYMREVERMVSTYGPERPNMGI